MSDYVTGCSYLWNWLHLMKMDSLILLEQHRTTYLAEKLGSEQLILASQSPHVYQSSLVTLPVTDKLL